MLLPIAEYNSNSSVIVTLLYFLILIAYRVFKVHFLN